MSFVFLQLITETIWRTNCVKLMTINYIVFCTSLSSSSDQYESQILVKQCGVHQQDKMLTCKVWNFQTWENFRLKKLSQLLKAKICWSDNILSCWSGNIFRIQFYDSFPTKNPSQFQVKSNIAKLTPWWNSHLYNTPRLSLIAKGQIISEWHFGV